MGRATDLDVFMKRLILLRHAKAERAAETGEDFDRALTERGHADAGRIGRLLSAAGLIPDLALVSAAKRTQETWAAAAPSLPDARLEVRRDLYEASAEALRMAAEGADANTVMIVAHNPGVQALASTLADEATLIDTETRLRLSQGFPTASAVAFEFDNGRLGCLGLFVPDERGGEAG